MKKILIVLITIIALTSCATTTTNAGKELRFSKLNLYLNIVTDKETGCRYLVYREMIGNSGGAGITPLLKSDGRIDCH
jgi:uncharacterized protein YceK